MSKGIKRMLTAVLAAAMVATYCVPSVFADTTADAGTEPKETPVYASTGSYMVHVAWTDDGEKPEVSGPVVTDVEGSKRGFAKLGKATLIESNGKMTVKFRLTSAKVKNVILGHDKAKNDPAPTEGAKAEDGTFSLPIEKLNEPIDISYYSTAWYKTELYVTKDLYNEKNIKINTDDIVNYVKTEQVNGTKDSDILATEKAFVDKYNDPMLVAGLIGSIYIHPKDTPEEQNVQRKWVSVVSKIAKYAYTKLSDEEKAEVPEIPDNAGYTTDKGVAVDGYEYPGAGGADYFKSTGDPKKDNPLNTKPDKKKEILVCSFGTSFTDSRAKTIGGIEKALTKAFPQYSVRRAFTSQVIMNHILARDDEKINTVKESFDLAKKAGVTEVIVVPTTLMQGTEYDLLKEDVRANQGKIRVKYALPLLGEVGKTETTLNADKKAVAKAITAEAVKTAGFKTLADADKAGTAFVFMGHGTGHNAAISYRQMQNQMKALKYNNVFIGTVEGNPEPTNLANVIKAVKAAGYKKVVLRPLMVVAGDHATNDMAGGADPKNIAVGTTDPADDSWAYAFMNGGDVEIEGKDEPINVGEGFGKENVTCQIAGLGQISSIQQLVVSHTKAAGAKAGLAKPAKTKFTKVKAAKKSAKLTWKKIKTNNKGYQIRYSTKKSMKKAKTTTVKSYKTYKKTIKKLKKGKKYYFQIRTYNSMKGQKTVYSSWSAKKSVKVK